MRSGRFHLLFDKKRRSEMAVVGGVRGLGGGDCRMLRQDQLSTRRLFAHASFIRVS